MFSEAAVTAVMKSASNRGFSKVTGKPRMVGSSFFSLVCCYQNIGNNRVFILNINDEIS